MQCLSQRPPSLLLSLTVRRYPSHRLDIPCTDSRLAGWLAVLSAWLCRLGQSLLYSGCCAVLEN